MQPSVDLGVGLGNAFSGLDRVTVRTGGDASRSKPGTSVEVTGAEGMTLIVRPPV